MRVSSLQLALLVLTLLFWGCSKNSPGPAPDPCAGITIQVNGTATNTTGPGKNDGSVAVTATGGGTFTFSLNGGAFQSAGVFSGLTAGTYTIAAKSSAGCLGSGSFTIADGDPCAGKTITVSATPTGSDKCAATGTIVVTASGSTGFMYRLNTSGSYQSAANFSSVPVGSHTIFVRDNGGCEKTAAVTVTERAAGSLFANVKSLLQSKCGACHITTTNGGANFGNDCNIVNLKDRIKVRAVDQGDMPQGGPALNAAEKKIITDWITAGGLVSN